MVDISTKDQSCLGLCVHVSRLGVKPHLSKSSYKAEQLHHFLKDCNCSGMFQVRVMEFGRWHHMWDAVLRADSHRRHHTPVSCCPRRIPKGILYKTEAKKLIFLIRLCGPSQNSQNTLFILWMDCAVIEGLVNKNVIYHWNTLLSRTTEWRLEILLFAFEGFKCF